MNKELFKVYLLQHGKKETTVKHYNDVARYIQKLTKVNIFDMSLPSQVDELKHRLLNIRDFVDVDTRGHRMYTAGINAYLNYLKTNLHEEQVSSSLLLSEQQRQTRLSKASKKPKKIILSSYSFVRNPDVVAHVLHRANGVCEICGSKAPFIRQSGDLEGMPYLEVHHKQFLSEGGEDSVENAIAICPNCHRNEHYGTRKFYK